MFDYAVIDNDSFGDLPMSSKALYFMLGMNTDDEGFVSFRKISKLYGFKTEDLKALDVKGFVIVFPSGIVVITHFHQNNYLNSVRSRPSIYQEERKQLTLTKDRKYWLNTCLAEARREENRRE